MSHVSTISTLARMACALLACLAFMSVPLGAEEDGLGDWLKKASEAVKDGANKLDQAKEAAKQAVRSTDALLQKLEGNEGMQFTLGMAYGLKNGVTEDIELAADVAKFATGAFDRALTMRKDDWGKASRDALEAVRGNLNVLMEISQKQAQELDKYVMQLSKELGNVKVELDVEKAWLVASSTGSSLYDAVSAANPAEGLEAIFSGKWVEKAKNVPPEMIDAVETAAFFIYLSFQEVGNKWNTLTTFEKGVITGLIIYAVAPWQRAAGVAKSSVDKMRDALKIRGKKGKAVTISFDNVAQAVKRRGDLGRLMKFCVLFGTAVMCEGGSKPIEHLQIGDVVRAPVDGVEQPCRITGISRCIAYRIMDIRYTTDAGVDGVISLTPDHQVWCDNRHAWLASSSLVPGDRLALSGDGAATVTGISDRRSEDGFQVADITVEDAHSFYVGREHVLIHNANAPMRNCERMTNLFQSCLDKRKGKMDLTPNPAKNFSADEKAAVWEAFQEALGKLRPPGVGKVNSLTVPERKDFYAGISKNYFKGGLIDPPSFNYNAVKKDHLHGTQWQHWFPDHLRKPTDGGNYNNGLVTRLGTPEAHTGAPNGIDTVINQRIKALRDVPNLVPPMPANKTPMAWFLERDLNYRADFLETVYKEEFSMKFPRALIVPGGNW